MKICGYFWGVIRKLYYFGGSFIYILGFFKVKIQNGKNFWGRKISFLGGGGGMPDIPDFFGGGGVGGRWFWVNSRCWVQACVWKKIEITPWGVFGYRFILLL